MIKLKYYQNECRRLLNHDEGFDRFCGFIAIQRKRFGFYLAVRSEHYQDGGFIG
jgi:hypothetical protein